MKVEGAVLGPPSLRSLMISVDVSTMKEKDGLTKSLLAISAASLGHGAVKGQRRTRRSVVTRQSGHLAAPCVGPYACHRRDVMEIMTS